MFLPNRQHRFPALCDCHILFSWVCVRDTCWCLSRRFSSEYSSSCDFLSGPCNKEPRIINEKTLPVLTTTHVSRWEWVENILINFPVLIEIRNCVWVVLKTTFALNLNMKIGNIFKLLPHRQRIHFLAHFPRIKENKDGLARRAISFSSGNNVPWPLPSGLALSSNCLLTVRF